MDDEERRQAGIEPEPPELVEVKVSVEPPESYIYSNISGVSVSPLDVRIHFADASPAKGGGPQVKTVIGIILPPEHAVGLAMVLTAQLDAYERQFGAIRNQPWRAMREEVMRKAEQRDAHAPKDKS